MTLDAHIAEDLGRTFGPGHFAPLPGRGNSRVGAWQADAKYFVKIYPQDADWNRRDVEERMIGFYAAHDIPCIPKLLHTSEALNYSVFRFIEGATGYAPDAATLAQLQQFLSRVMALPAESFTTEAKEAFFQTRTLKLHINQRLSFLRQLADPTLQSYLKYSLERTFAQTGYEDFPDIACGGIIVSPSDFGLHNTILAGSNTVYFIDFEYGGRDSKFKLLGDIYWHPGNSATSQQRLALIGNFLDSKEEWAVFEQVRVLMGFKWSLLLLNEFIPSHLAKRMAADGRAANEAEVKQRQLAKSASVLEKVLHA